MITVKFGGTSLAGAERFRHAADIILADSRRRYVVVSAPGKRHSADTKITDLLYRFQQTGEAADFQPIAQRFQEIVRKLGIHLDLTADFAQMQQPGHSREYMASRGEYLSGKIMAALLGWEFVDAADCVFFDREGNLDSLKTEHSIWEKLKNKPHAVIPGFYGAKPDGEIHTFTRGGSDVTGALVARAMEAEAYENWTDVDGMLVTDPRIVPEAQPIRAITYRELRELAYQGATVLHEDAVLPVRKLGIPIHILNTFEPTAPGSWIVEEAKESRRPVTGIAGKKGYAIIQIEKEQTNSRVGYVRSILSCLEKRGISFEHLATGIGSVSLVVPAQSIADCREDLEWDIRKAVNPDSLLIQQGLAMIAVVGRGMKNHPGVAAMLFDAVSRIGVSVRVIDQGSSEMNIVIGVNEADYEKSVRAIYGRFFGSSWKEGEIN